MQKNPGVAFMLCLQNYISKVKMGKCEMIQDRVYKRTDEWNWKFQLLGQNPISNIWSAKDKTYTES